VIYCMTASQRLAVIRDYPDAASKTHCLDADGDIQDPIGKTADVYWETARRIQALVRLRFEAMGVTATTPGAAMAMRFHWSRSWAGEKFRGAKARAAVGIPSLDTLARFCKHAEDCEIESLLTAFGFHRPDPLVLAGALGVLTSRIKFMVAVRSGIM